MDKVYVITYTYLHHGFGMSIWPKFYKTREAAEKAAEIEFDTGEYSVDIVELEMED